MTIDLIKTFNDLEEQRLVLLQRLEGVDQAHLNANPQPDKWSIMQILCHLSLAERLSVDYLRKKIGSTKELEKSGVMSTCKTWALKMLLRSSLKFKAPARSTDIPVQQQFEITRSEWDKIRREMREVVEGFPDEMKDSVVFKHPVVGPMNMGQTLSFLKEHYAHHARQIEALLEGLG